MANTTTRKPTKRDHFTTLLGLSEVQANPKLVEFITHEMELLEKKNAADKKPTAQQTANDAIKVAIVTAMERGKRYTITDLIKNVPECADLTNQRVSALVRQLVDNHTLERIEDKRKAYFSLA
jgi:hypothetical protein